jgi:hypothetical protein
MPLACGGISLAETADEDHRKLLLIKSLHHSASVDSFPESFFSSWGALAGGIRNLSFSSEAANFSHNAEGSQYQHFHDPGLTAQPAMLLYRPKLRICYDPLPRGRT